MNRKRLRSHLPLLALGAVFAVAVAITQCSSGDAQSLGGGPDSGALATDAAPDATTCHHDGDCSALPASHCASSSELVYYSSGACNAGRCEFTAQTMECPCYGGGCSFTTTTGGTGPMGSPTGTAGAGQGDAAEDAALGHATVAAPDSGACAGDASAGTSQDASICEVPPSVCADGRWLAYFTDPSCGTTGRCSWSTNYRDCGEGQCESGGCRFNFTL